METRTLSPTKALEFQVLLQATKAGKLKLGPGHYKVEAKGDMLLVDPVNSEPFIFVAPTTALVFPVKPGSGTDHLKQRMLAGLHFEQLAAAA